MRGPFTRRALLAPLVFHCTIRVTLRRPGALARGRAAGRAVARRPALVNTMFDYLDFEGCLALVL